MTDPNEQIQAPGEGINESLVHSDNSSFPAVQWTGTNMADVLKFATHGKSCVNSFGDPCVISGGRYMNVEIGQWVFRDADEQLHVCSGDVLGFITALVDVAVETETARDELEERIRKALVLAEEFECANCEHPAKAHVSGRCAVPLMAWGVERACGCDWGNNLTDDIRAILSGSDTATNTEERTLPEIEVSVMNAEEWKAACKQALDDIGFTFDELAEMAARRDFPTSEARKVWLAIGGRSPDGREDASKLREVAGRERRFVRVDVSDWDCPEDEVYDRIGDTQYGFTLTKEEWAAAAKARLDELGLTYAELAAMARDNHFTSSTARKLWVLIGGTLEERTDD